jgi:hypothetical protein
VSVFNFGNSNRKTILAHGLIVLVYYIDCKQEQCNRMKFIFSVTFDSDN